MIIFQLLSKKIKYIFFAIFRNRNRNLVTKIKLYSRLPKRLNHRIHTSDILLSLF